MVNLCMKVNRGLLDFSSENLNIETIEIKEYNTVVSNCNEFLNNLFQCILRVKGDWIKMSYDETLGTCYATIDLIFHGSKMDSNSSILLNKIMQVINKYVLDNKTTGTSIINVENLNFDDDGFFVLFTEDGGSAQVNHLEIEKKFLENNIKFERVCLTSNQYEGGCGSGAQNVLYFIVGAAASGVTWDCIKLSANYLYGKTEEVSIKRLESKNFKRLRKDVADKIRIKENLLVVQEICIMENNIKIDFKTKENVINLITDKEYNILEMKVG